MAAWDDTKVETFKENFYTFLNSCVVNSKEKGRITLGDNIYSAQRVFLDCIFNALKRDVHDIKVLKSRQLGLSTISRALSLFWLGVHNGLRGAMVFDTDANKENARKEIEEMVRNLPKRMKFPRISSYNRYGITLDNDSQMLFMSAGIRSSKGSGQLGRSTGLNFVHASELCSWEAEEGIVSFKQALSETFPDRLYIYESTARGFNSWHTMWEDAKSDDLNQATCFLGWYLKDSQRIERGTEMFRRYGNDAPNEIERKRIQAVKEQYGFDVDIEQLAWYRRKTDPAREKDPGEPTDGFTQSEQPWTEEESWVATGSTFFQADKLTAQIVAASQLKHQSYKFYPGADFPHSDFEVSKYRRDIHLKVWEEPDPNGMYVVSADPAFGHDERNDRSACEVLRCYADGCDQVAEYASASIPAHQFAWLIAALCGWYHNVLFILEINGPGEAVWNEYRSLPKLLQGYQSGVAQEHGLNNILGNVRNYVYQRADSMGVGASWQFKTQTSLKVSIMERLRDFVSTGAFKIRSVDALEEMRTVTRDGDSIKAEGYNKRDDRVMALAMGGRAWEEKLRPMLIAQNRTRQAEVARKQLSARGRYELFTKNTLESFLKQKEARRIMQEIRERRASWRGR